MWAPAPPPKSSLMWEQGWPPRMWDCWAQVLEKGRRVGNFHVLNSVLIGEDEEIVQAQHPSMALLLRFSVSLLLPQVLEMSYPVSGQTQGFICQNFPPLPIPERRRMVAGFVVCFFFPPSISNEEKERWGEKNLKACQSKHRYISALVANLENQLFMQLNL